MTGNYIESLLEMIDGNIGIARDEALQYIKDHEAEIVTSLARTGTATIKTAAGDLQLKMSDLTAA
jgi:hypothetical protein